ncbi:MAG TPA: hypothetical protein VGE76_02195 [Opitutaceae bacterium]
MRWLLPVLALALAGFGAWRLLRPKPPTPPARHDAPPAGDSRQTTSPPAPAERAPGQQPAPPSPRPLTAAEKAQRIEQITRDYDEVRVKLAAEYSAAGKDYPGGLNAFLRELALLEREKRRDFAAVLDSAELEAMEYRETAAGKTVARLLQGTEAPEEVKRAVFRQQLAYQDRFALTFDISPPALLERETARQQLQREIRGILGDSLFAVWLKGEGADIDALTRLATEHGLPPGRTLELWELKNEFTRRRLELNAQTLPAAQRTLLRAELTREITARVDNLLGPNVPAAARREALGWLPAK